MVSVMPSGVSLLNLTLALHITRLFPCSVKRTVYSAVGHGPLIQISLKANLKNYRRLYLTPVLALEFGY